MNRKVIAITGVSRGLGRALCETMLERGHRVYGCSRSAATIEHSEYTHFELDVGDERSVVAMFNSIRRSKEPLYALINNAGVAAMNHALLTPGTTVERLLRVNLLGTILCSREAAKQMTRHRLGRIINFSTVAEVLNLEGEAAYVATKAAVSSYSRVLAREVGDRGITVNVVAPNPVRTALVAGVPEDKLAALNNRLAIKRFGTYEDILNVVDFYLDPRSEFITGQTIFLGGP